jgi:hypothetical protein
VPVIDRPPPTNFPPRVTIRFDVQEQTEPVMTAMSLKKTSRSQHSSLNELNITPLLDLVFVLLVIFIITTPQMMNNLEINLPSGKPPVRTKPKIQAQPHRGQRTPARSLSTPNAPVTPCAVQGYEVAAAQNGQPRLGRRASRARRSGLSNHGQRHGHPPPTRHHEDGHGDGIGSQNNFKEYESLKNYCEKQLQLFLRATSEGNFDDPLLLKSLTTNLSRLAGVLRVGWRIEQP